MTPPYDLPRRPAMPVGAFGPRTLNRHDVTVPPGAGLTSRDQPYTYGPTAKRLSSACLLFGRFNQKASTR